MIPYFFYGSGMYRKHPNHTYGRNRNNSANNQAIGGVTPNMWTIWLFFCSFKMMKFVTYSFNYHTWICHKNFFLKFLDAFTMSFFIIEFVLLIKIQKYIWASTFQRGPFYESNNNIPGKINEIGHLVSKKVYNLNFSWKNANVRM